MNDNTPAVTWDRIADVLGMSRENMIRDCLDMDVADGVRLLVDEGVDTSDRAAVERVLWRVSRSRPRGFIDAVLIAGRPASTPHKEMKQ